MAKQSSAAIEKAEAEASEAVVRSVAAKIGRPLGGIVGILGFGLGLAALGTGAHSAAAGWLSLGAFGFAMAAVGSDSTK